jgi:hypothetical protein
MAIRARTVTAGRNDPCPCGSGKKFKKCCERKVQRQGGRTMMYIVLALIIGAIVAGVASLRETSYTTGGAGRVWSPEHGHYH